MKECIIYILIIVCTISCNTTKPTEIQINWNTNLQGDFSFIENWSYPEGIFLNEHGQLSCDGICPPQINNMFDEKGKIIDDSLIAFYNLVDTTHHFHSIASETNIREWTGTNFISVTRINKDTIKCTTWNNSGTHSSLNLVITNNIIKPSINFNSINSPEGIKVFECSGGKMVIDQDLWQKGILKASFDFKFNNTYKSQQPLYWKGLIYKIVEPLQKNRQIILKINPFVYYGISH